MKVLITGGAGYIGIELAYAFSILKEVEEIFIYDSFLRSNANVFSGHRKFQKSKVHYIEADILDNQTLGNFLDQSDIVIHAAAQLPTKNGSVSAHNFEQINNWGSSVIADELFKLSSRKLRVIYLSSLSVFGSGSINSLNEIPNPQSFYGISKLRGERHFERLQSTTGHKVSILRCPSVYGYSENLRIDSSFNKMIFDANFLGKVTISGDSDFSYPHINIQNLIQYIVIEALASDPEIFLYPKFSNIDPNTVFLVLSEIINNLEVIYIDQGVYESSLTFKEDLELHENITDGFLKKNIIEFLANFNF